MGFGDSLPHPGFLGTNVTRLLRASRADSVILKPAHPALRLDRVRPSPGCSDPNSPQNGCGEVWAATTVPSRKGGSPKTDRRANSLARLQHVAGTDVDPSHVWWYSLLATDVPSTTSPECDAVTGGNNDRVVSVPCDTVGIGARLAEDGTLRVPLSDPGNAGAFSCAVPRMPTLDKGTPTELGLMVVAPSNLTGCGRFALTATHQLQVIDPQNPAPQCVTEVPSQSSHSLVLSPCVADTEGHGQGWARRGSLSGLYDEAASGHQLQITTTNATLALQFLGSAWSTANCTLVAGGSGGHQVAMEIDPAECLRGHFAGGSVGARYPACWWNATIAMPTIETSSTTSGCGGCCLHTVWKKRSFATANADLASVSSGQCMAGCGGVPNATHGAFISPHQLFPTPPNTTTFLVAPFGGVPCLSGSLASSCLAPWSATLPLDVSTLPCPSGSGCRNWKLLSVAPVLPGGWVLVGELGKYVAVSPQRFTSAVAINSTDAEAENDGWESDGLDPAELGLPWPSNTTSQGELTFLVRGMPGETVNITIVVPQALKIGVSDLEMALGGHIDVLSVTLSAAGALDVVCTVSLGCRTSL